MNQSPTEYSRDERLAELIGNLCEELRCGKLVDIDAVASDNPELDRELRELWATIVVAQEIAPLESPRVSSTAHPGDVIREIDGYVIEDEIGRGGMGIVYRAREKSLDRVVALKIMLAGDRASDSDQARFKVEAEAAANLEHPNIVTVFAVGQVKDCPYFSMKYIEGQTLESLLAKGPLPPRDAAQLLIPICRALHYAHECGVLHRDIKPSNILIDADNNPLITDFGLAKRTESDSNLTHTGAIVGTPSYMAPEQVVDQARVCPVSDVYALGCVLYHMTTGRPPLQAATPVHTILLLLEQDPLPPSLINPSVDRDLEMVTLKCLQKPQELRYESAALLADDLELYLAGEQVSARAFGLPAMLSRAFRETYHAPVLENWGLLWIWHSLVLLVICSITQWIHWRGVTSIVPYLGLWAGGFAVWAPIFLAIRRRGGPVTFVERQIVHIWAASVLSNVFLFFVELILKLDVLTLSPVLGLTSATVFLVKAGILSGAFYIQAACLFATSLAMAIWPDVGLIIFGIVSALCFLIPGLKYYRQRKAAGAPQAMALPFSEAETL